MIVNAKELWTKVLPECMIKTQSMPKQFYYMITTNRVLQRFINENVILEFLYTDMIPLIDEILYTKDLKIKDNYYMTSCADITELENIIDKVYIIKYLGNEQAELTLRE